MLYTHIDELIAKSIKEKDTCRTGVLRMIKSELHFAETRDNPKERVVLNDDTERELLMKMNANYEEAIKATEERGLTEEAEKNKKELAILREFLPPIASDDDIQAYAEDVVRELKETNGSVSVKDTKTVIDKVKAKFNSQSIGKIVSGVIRNAN